MPARKPAGLNRRHDTKAEKAERAQAEDALRPLRALPMNPPARLQGHEKATAAWRRLMRIYSELQAEIVTALDEDLLADYCIALEQAREMDAMRKAAAAVYEQLERARVEAVERQELELAVSLGQRVLDALDQVVKLDSRVDRKRSLLLQMRQSLYLTPRARAGVAPAPKEKEEPLDDMEAMLRDVGDYVNGAK